MSRLVPVVLVLLSLLLPPVFAQERAPAAKVKPTTVRRATPVPVATPIPEKRSFFQRLFGRRKPKPTPAPTPAPTPKPRSKSRPTTGTRAKPKAPATATKPKPDTTPGSPAQTTEPSANKPTPATPTPKPAAKKTTGKSTGATKPTAPPPPNGADPEVAEKHKYDVAKAKAVEDPAIQALKEKADNAVSDDEARKAQTAYNRALFEKMRKLDPSIKERIDKMEAALMKRVGK